MSLGGKAPPPYMGGFPRVSGDEPALVSVISGAIRFSPRERG